MHKTRAFYIGLFAALYLLLLTSLRTHYLVWDEAVYLSMAKFIFTYADYGLFEIYRPLFLPLVLSPLFVLKSHSYIVLFARLIISFFSLLSVFFIYLITRKLFGKKAAFFSVFLTLSSYVFIKSSTSIMTGIVALSFILASFYMALNNKPVFAAIFSFLAFFSRFPAGIVIISNIAIYAYMAFCETKKHKNKLKLKARPKKASLIALYKAILSSAYAKQAFAYIIAVVILFLAFLATSYFFGYDIIKGIILASMHQSVASRNITGIYGIFFYLAALLKTSPLLAIGILPFYYLLARKTKAREKKALYLVALFFLPFYIYFTSIPHKQQRFSLLFLPLFIIPASFFIGETIKKLNKKAREKKALYKKALFVAIVFFAFITIAIFASNSLGYGTMLTRNFSEDAKAFSAQLKNSSCIIATTTPMPAFFVDAKFVHIYDSPGYGLKKFLEKKQELSAVVFNISFYPCLEDSLCLQKKQSLKEIIEKSCKKTASLFSSDVYVC